MAAVECGIDPLRFWDMTLWELERAMKAKQKQQKQELQTRAFIAYQQAGVTAALMARAWGSKQKVPELSTVFPGLFPADEQDGRQSRQQDWRIMKARMEAYAEARRKWGEQQNGKNNRGAANPVLSENDGLAEGTVADRQQAENNGGSG